VNFSKAYEETLFRFGLKASDIAEKAGISESTLSQFKNGKNVRIETMEKILGALPQDAKVFMLNLVAQEEEAPDQSEPKKDDIVDNT